MLVQSIARYACLAGACLAWPLVQPATAHAATEAPWSDTWVMPLAGEERTFVDYDGTSYLRITAADLADRAFVRGKDVALTAKFADRGRQGPRFYGLDELRVVGAAEFWARLLDGDNVHLLGTISDGSGGQLELQVTHVLPARSDAERIAERLSEIPAADYAARIELARWVRAQSEREGNTTFWLAAADDLVRETVRAAAAAASEDADVALLQQAMEWAITEASDTELAAELGSQPWVQAADDEAVAAIAARMQGLGYILFGSGEDARWLTQSEALGEEYAQRFEGMHWRDADGFYELGRWADRHADVLPNARELAQRAYRAGLQAHPGHAGIRHELGLPPPTEEQRRSARREQDFRHASGIAVGAPADWDRSATPVVSSADATWIDPRSDSAYLAVRVIDEEAAPAFAQVWDDQVALHARRAGFEAEEPEAVAHPEGRARSMDFQLRAGDELRRARLLLVYDEAEGYGLSLVVSYHADEAEQAAAALASAAEQIELPARPEPEPEDDGEAIDGGEEPLAPGEVRRSPNDPAAAAGDGPAFDQAFEVAEPAAGE